jgi:hypothetical protein
MIPRINSTLEVAVSNIKAWRDENPCKGNNIYIIEHSWKAMYGSTIRKEYSYSLVETTKAVAVLKTKSNAVQIYKKDSLI